MADSYWWSRFGDFEPGEGVLPHMGQVVAHYRKKYGCKTQTSFAIVVGAKGRTVIEWECSPVLDYNRRVFFSRLLKIPPVLLGLDWRAISYQDPQGISAPEIPPEHVVDAMNDESYYLYETALLATSKIADSGGLMSMAGRFEMHMRKLEEAVKRVREWEKEAWLGLLCQYHLFAVAIASRRGGDETNEQQVLLLNARALKIAQEIEDQELQALFWLNRADIQFEQESTVKARVSAHQALQAAEKIGRCTPLYGNIQLMTAPILLPETVNNPDLLKSIRRSQDKILNSVWDKQVEPDRSFMRLSLAGVHHERAKVFLALHKLYPEQGYLKDASNEMKLTWDGFSPEFAEWELYFHLTEARLYEAQNEVEQSAQAGVEALKVARSQNSKRKEDAIVALYRDLRKRDERNSYVRHLGVQLGQF